MKTTGKALKRAAPDSDSSLSDLDAASAPDMVRPASAAVASAAKIARKEGPVVFWFRKDLRTRDNRGLHRAWVQAAHVNRTGGVRAVPGSAKAAAASPSAATKSPLNGALLTIFVVCGLQWNMHDYAPVKVDFLFRNLRDLQRRLEADAIPLTVLHAATINDVPRVVRDFCAQHGATHLHYNLEYEVDEGKRDEKTAALAREAGITVVPSHDECVVPPGLVTTKEGRCPVVYSPFRRRWEQIVHDKAPQDWLALSAAPEPNPPAVRKAVPHLFGTPIPDPAADPASLPGYELPFVPAVLEHARGAYPGGEDAGHTRLTEFVNNKIKAYSVDRDFPALDGNAAISAYLALGIVSARQCIAAARAANDGSLDKGDKGCVHWIQEIVWREFYRHILVAFPRVCMNQPFKLNTNSVPWSAGPEAEAQFQAWCEGKTGYPLVDAGMRQLLATGFMSNRLRMVSAMFLTKDLLIDWRRGEKFFMQHLIDGDLASNNGGWQWAASTGTDSQPYFRIFNPYLQSAKFDGEGTFIRKYVPELRAVKDNKAIHEPNAKLPTYQFMKLGYPAPIVDHKAARERVLAAFKVPADQAH
ncbi:DNA photolyase phr1 [Blastocladiella emersonii ATCC 22665]|nr:DNA photolyase phr1 [Blastocladiella emersonii ATCC 22665]